MNFIRILSIKSESRDKCSGSILDLIDYIQMKILHFKLTSIIKRNND